MNMLLCIFLAVAWLTKLQARNWDRFEVIWNVPSSNCYRLNVSMPLQEDGIRVNDKQEFYGENIVTFYEQNIGLYPYFRNHSDPQSAVNGGIPQLVNMTAHLLKVRHDIKKAIPNSGFDGLGIIDFEDWRPLWSVNWGSKRIYKNVSVAYVRQRYPNISNKSAEKLAATEFNSAAAEFMLETIRVASSMRPYALWGFYGFPYCNYDAGQHGEMECKEEFKNYNDRLQFLYRASSALYPSIYLRSEMNDSVNYRYIQAVLQEARRCANQLKRETPVITFTSIEYQPFTNLTYYYRKTDLCNSLKQATDLGLRGAIIWSTSKNMTKQRCNNISAYVTEHLGPYVKAVKEFSTRCANKRCMGHGQCILRVSLQPPCVTNKDMAEYDCLCDVGFEGPYCNKHRYFPWLYTPTNSKDGLLLPTVTDRAPNAVTIKSGIRKS